MKLLELRYSRTIKPADYEAETIEIGAKFEEGDDIATVASTLQSEVAGVLGIDGAAVAVNPTAKATQSKTTKKVTKKAPAKTTKKVTKKAPAKKAPAKKSVPYDRKVKAHKTELGKILFENYPEWDKDEVLAAKAAELSASLEGTDMFDSEGNVLDTFLVAITSEMDTCFEEEGEEESVL